jgi:hypothetical protein
MKSSISLFLLIISSFTTSLAYGEICKYGLCLSPSYSESPLKYIPISVSDVFFVIPVEDSGLPPDPGEDGEKTLLGVDSDGDGIRDDVFRYVVTKYWDDPHAELVLLKTAKISQNIMSHSNEVEVVKNEFDKISDIRFCAEVVLNDASLKFKEIRDVLYNTPIRYENFLKSQSLLSSNVYLYVDPAKFGDYCPGVQSY